MTASLLTLSLFSQTPCVNGMAGDYPCLNVDLWAAIPIEDLGGGQNGNDCWGWTSPSGREYALFGRSNGTAFVEITDPESPIYLGNLPTFNGVSLWRDLKVFNDYVFIVSEASAHGMQVFDLMQLEDVVDPPVTFEHDAHYGLFGNAHNIAINEESGFAYAVGTSTFNGGLHIVDINDPLNPDIAGDFSLDGYTHDAQIVIYNGPHVEYQGKEIAFAANEDAVTIVDVDDKLNASMLGTATYEDVGYIHQGWLTVDHRFFIVNDELDEIDFGNNTRSYIFDVQDLENPTVLGFFESDNPASDHNLYVKDNLCYQANYRSGLRILNIDNIEEVELYETGFFDTNPESDGVGFDGAWSTYPYFESGNVLISTFSHLFIVKPTEGVFETSVQESTQVSDWELFPNPSTGIANIRIDASKNGQYIIRILDSTGRPVKVDTLPSSDPNLIRIDVSILPSGMYIVGFENQPGSKILLKH